LAAMTKYKLPDLQYDYGALEPHVSGKIMQLHHDKHHAAYVAGANKALADLAEAREKKDYAKIYLTERQLAFHLSGHVMHSLFWQNLSPDGGDKPAGPLAQQIDADFGSFDGFKDQLTNATMTIMGSGWGALAWDPVAKRLVTQQIHDHQSHTTQGSVPLLVVDAWEHAFYLQYLNDKGSFFKALWNVFNWKDVSARFEKAKSADLVLKNAIE
jgi:Fe-Mn family superoxide dismutase